MVRSPNTGCYATLCSYVGVYFFMPKSFKQLRWHQGQSVPTLQDPNTTVSVRLQKSTATQSAVSVQQLTPEVSSQNFHPISNVDLNKWQRAIKKSWCVMFNVKLGSYSDTCFLLFRGITMGEAAVLLLETWRRTGGALLKTSTTLSSPMTFTSVRSHSQTLTNPL